MTDQRSDFPILCQTCLGDNPFIRMTKEANGRSCKICDRPNDVYRWKPGPSARFKKTQICQTCAKLKNVCQTCILDLQFGLPVQVRDKALGDAGKIDVPVSTVNRDFQFEEYEKRMKENGPGAVLIPGSTTNKPYAVAAASKLLADLARKRPYYKRNLPHVCSFFEKGECSRGSECPYRHEKDDHDESLKNQKIKNRFYGVKDPVAEKMLRVNAGKTSGANSGGKDSLEPPEDESIVSLFLGGIDGTFKEADLSEQLKKYGDIVKIDLLPIKGCGFVTFSSRAQAEKAMKKLQGQLKVNGNKLKVGWSKKSNSSYNPKGKKIKEDYLPPPGMASLPKSYYDPNSKKEVKMPQMPSMHFVPPPGQKAMPYPSMDRKNYSASLAKRRTDY